ncbi:MAG: SGNH/GDSL hydrolase family protein [Puniceicoccales bacterium]|jgi:lysophospholipase L1-like esterase|nr:SGNH/GDSL hydrolase family protein [Puniceicoccales bacterium]
MNSRRNFLKNSALFGSLVGLPSLLASTPARAATAGPIDLKKGAVILFQGDSITDSGRSRGRPASQPNNSDALGKGYAFLAAAALLRKYPGKDLKIFNRGISGNKIPDLAGRWEKDTVALQPDVLSILIGVNDYWHSLRSNNPYKGTLQDYENGFRDLLKRTKEKLPGTKIVLCEPFVLETGTVTKAWFPAFDEYRKAARKIAEEFGATFIPCQSVLNDVSKDIPKNYWSHDGIHLTLAGAQLMANAWVSAFK